MKRYVSKVSMEKEVNTTKNIYYPPGGILMWILIFLELITFGMAMVAMLYQGKQEAILFHESKTLLNTFYGFINTLFLLTSGYFMAIAVQQIKQGRIEKTINYLKLTIVFGGLFLLIKSIEYYTKITAGIGIDYNTFFTYYWLLTLFHVIHVLVGLVILLVSYFRLKKYKDDVNIDDFEAGAAFWHMCDLIWLLLFPVIYLIF